MKRVNLQIEFDENELIDEETKELMRSKAKAYARSYADQVFTDEIKRKIDAAIEEFFKYDGVRRAIGNYTDNEITRMLSSRSDNDLRKMIEDRLNERVQRFLDSYEIERMIKESMKKYIDAMVQNMLSGSK